MMNTKWHVNKEELYYISTLFRADSIPETQKEIISEIARRWKKEGLFVPYEDTWRLEEGFQLALATMMDPVGCFSCERNSGQSRRQRAFYFHGETILLLEDSGDAELNLIWLPFLPLAIGAVSEMFQIEDSNEVTEECYCLEGYIGTAKEFDKKLYRQETLFIAEQNDGQSYKKIEIVHEITEFLSRIHKQSLEEVVHFE